MIRIRVEQTAMFEGVRPAPPDRRANRGMELEGRLEVIHARYAASGAARVDKQYVKALPVKNGQWAKVIGRCTVDYTGVMRGGYMVALDAKDCCGTRIALDRLQRHQLDYLRQVARMGGCAFVLVRFEDKCGEKRVYAIPIAAWCLAVMAHEAGTCREEDDFKATGKASIAMDELPEEWQVKDYDWLSAIDGH